MSAARAANIEEVRALLERGHVYLDVRSPAEFEEGRPSGAINVPWQVLGESGPERNPDFERVVAERFPLDAPLVLGCKSAARAAHAGAALALAGFSNVTISRVGFDGVRDHFGRVVDPGWSRLGLPVDRG